MMLKLLLASTLLIGGCAASRPALVTDGAGRMSRPLVIYMNSADSFSWDGWGASQSDLPRLVQQYHPQAVVLRAFKGACVDFGDAIKLRTAIAAQGVPNVTIASGRVSDG